MSPYDLTTLSAVKSWLGLPSAAGPNDTTLAALVTAARRAIYSALGRPACCRNPIPRRSILRPAAST